VLLVTHAGVIRSLLCRILKMPIGEQFRLQIPHAALISVIADADYPRLELGCNPAATPPHRHTAISP